jgi:hypothetical protein
VRSLLGDRVVVKSRLILDTSACNRIASSPNHKQIEAHLDLYFRRVVSVQTFWELMDRVDGGDGTHFEDNKRVLRIAAGTYSNPIMLPMPIAHAIQTILKLPRPEGAVGPHDLKRLYAVIMRAKSRNELYIGVRPGSIVRKRIGFKACVIRQQQEEGEQAHIAGLRRAKRTNVNLYPRDEWAFNLAKQLGSMLEPEQASRLGETLDAAYTFDLYIAKLAKEPNYYFEKHRKDWADLQQTMYLCDPAIYVMTANERIVQRVKGSHHADRVIYLLDYLKRNALVV